MAEVVLKRIYDTPAKSDGTRVLIDRLWPRGLSKQDAAIDWWAKELAPSTELRKWFAHEEQRWEEFQRRYEAELDQQPDALNRLNELINSGPVTICFGSKDARFNNAVALLAYLDK